LLGGSINSVKRSNNPPKKGAEEMRGTNVHTFVPRNAWYKLHLYHEMRGTNVSLSTRPAQCGQWRFVGCHR
jgi:hypothetical protein